MPSSDASSSSPTIAPDSGTLDPVTSTSPRRPALYWRLWRRVPQELGFLALTLPLGVVAFSLSIGLFSAGVGTLITFFIGIFLLIALFYVVRGFGTLELIRLGWAGQRPIPRPNWSVRPRRPGFLGWIGSIFGNAHYWLYVVHFLVINFAVSAISWMITVFWFSVALGGVSYWFWSRFLPASDHNDASVTRSVFWLFGDRATDGRYDSLDPLFYFLIGLIFLGTLPFVTRGLVAMHQGIALALLGAFRSEALEREVIGLTESRGAAIAAEGHSLRRLERDIHDGPQQRLVRLQMDLAAADRQLDGNPEQARALISEAMEQSRQALEELRSLSRGFAPPILLDRGLVAALESASIRSAIPTTVTSRLPEGFELPQEVERNAYFVASEALANAAKHSDATIVTVTVALRRVAETDETWLDVTVRDNGGGGAVSRAGHGLAGLDERLRGLGGILELSSPLGGPTVLTAHLPLTTELGSRTEL
jgi:signal transduction histidine kinase